jgi:hypothetical protein
LVFILAICNLFPHVTCTISFTNSHPLSLKSPWVLSFLFFVVSCPCFLVVPLHEGLLKPPCCLVSSKILSKPRGSSSNWTGPSQPVYGLHTHTHKKKKIPTWNKSICLYSGFHFISVQVPVPLSPLTSPDWS